MTISSGQLESLIASASRLIAEGFVENARTSRSEEDLRHACNTLIDTFIRDADLQITGRHEYGLAGGRIDSKYAGVIIEYKEPMTHSRQRRDGAASKRLISQLEDRFHAFETHEATDPVRIFGVGTDGHSMLFMRHAAGGFEVDGPLPTSEWLVERLLRALVSLGAQGKSFSPSNLAADFGADSPVAQEGVRVLYGAIRATKSEKASTFFRQWRILFGEICGYDVDSTNPRTKLLAKHYGLPAQTKPAALLFAMHTYYAIFMKFLAAELAASFSAVNLSPTRRAAAAPTSTALRREMEELEAGGIWAALGITNFLEGDLFAWYVAAWDGGVASVVRGVLRNLDEYDRSTLSVDPSDARDLLKQLYQQLFPRAVRHALGEYYTPDWLAEQVLNDVGYDGDPNSRFLDPACGSGTFLVMAIARARRWFDRNRHSCGFGEAELAKRLLANIAGFDLNPLAVMASRTNYILAIRDLLRHLDRVELPVYLCDSVMTPTEYGGLFQGDLGTTRRLRTAVGDFLVPTEIATERQQLANYADTLEFCVRNKYSAKEFLERCTDAGLVIGDAEAHVALYARLRKLDSTGQNGIWARIIKNSFAPLLIGQVDYVCGNPPWVNWESLPEDYRDALKPLWQRYGLFTLSGGAGRLGGGKKDLAMLFVYSCVDSYLPMGGRLGFVITQTVLKTSGAGDGFRRFWYEELETKGGGAVFLIPQAVQDLSGFQPFEAATNRTATFVCEKAQVPMTYPVPYTVWLKERGASFGQESSLQSVLRQTRRMEWAATPVDARRPTSPWLTAPAAVLPSLQKLIGKGDYKAFAGVCTWLNGVFWLSVIRQLSNGDVLVSNLNDIGRIHVDRVEARLEEALIYPLLRGRDVESWHATPAAALILTQDAESRAGIPEPAMKKKFPHAYAYLKRFEVQLRNRAGFRQYFSPDDPFWAIYNVGPYTLSPWKVVWREQSRTFQCAVVGPRDGKAVIPDHKLMVVDAGGEEAAYFVAGVLSSSPVRLAVQSYVVSTSTSTHVLENIAVPLFRREESFHRRIAAAAARCQELALGDRGAITALEQEIDEMTASLWGIGKAELDVIQATLADLNMGETADEEEEEEAVEDV